MYKYTKSFIHPLFFQLKPYYYLYQFSFFLYHSVELGTVTLTRQSTELLCYFYSNPFSLTPHISPRQCPQIKDTTALKGTKDDNSPELFFRPAGYNCK